MAGYRPKERRWIPAVGAVGAYLVGVAVLFILQVGDAVRVPLPFAVAAPPLVYAVLSMLLLGGASPLRRVSWIGGACLVHLVLTLLAGVELTVAGRLPIASALAQVFVLFVPAPVLTLLATPFVLSPFVGLFTAPPPAPRAEPAPRTERVARTVPPAASSASPASAASTTSRPTPFARPVPPGSRPQAGPALPKPSGAAAPTSATPMATRSIGAAPATAKPAVTAASLAQSVSVTAAPASLRAKLSTATSATVAAPALQPAPLSSASPVKPFARLAAGARTDDVMLRISFERVAAQLPAEAFVLPFDRLAESLKEPHTLLVPRRVVLAQMRDGAVSIDWPTISSQFPDLALGISESEFRSRYADLRLTLPVDEILEQLPADTRPLASAVLSPEAAQPVAPPPPLSNGHTPSPVEWSLPSLPATADIVPERPIVPPPATVDTPLAEPPAASEVPVAPPATLELTVELPTVRELTVEPSAVSEVAVSPPAALELTVELPTTRELRVELPAASEVPLELPSAPEPMVEPAPTLEVVALAPAVVAPVLIEPESAVVSPLPELEVIVPPAAPIVVAPVSIELESVAVPPPPMPEDVSPSAAVVVSPAALDATEDEISESAVVSAAVLPEREPALVAPEPLVDRETVASIAGMFARVGTFEAAAERVDGATLISVVATALPRDEVNACAARASRFLSGVAGEVLTVRTELAVVVVAAAPTPVVVATPYPGIPVALLELRAARAVASLGAGAATREAWTPGARPERLPVDARATSAASALSSFGAVEPGVFSAGLARVYVLSAIGREAEPLAALAAAVCEALHDIGKKLGPLVSVELARGTERTVVRPLGEGREILAVLGTPSSPGRGHRDAARAASELEGA
jgi:hypothetical protein